MIDVTTIPQPGFNLLAAPQGIWSTFGIKNDVTNEYGVASNGEITTLKSLLPGIVGRNFFSVGTTGERVNMVKVNGLTVADFAGGRWLRNGGGSADWNFMHYNATFANMRWTVTMLVRPGYSSNPNGIVALLGNNGGSSGSKGFCIFIDDRQTIATANRRLSHNITRGTGGSFISNSGDNDTINFNEWHTYTFTYDASQSTANRFKAYVENTQISLPSVTSNSSTPVTTPTNDLEIMGVGNSVFSSSGQVAVITIQSVVEVQATREAFVNSLEPYRTALNNFNNKFLHVIQKADDDGTRYYMPCFLAQNPISGKIVKFFREDASHVASTAAKIQRQESSDNGETWTAPATWYDPGGSWTTGNIVGNYDDTGRLWLFIGDVTDVTLTPVQCTMFYSDDDGTTTTSVDVTSRFPADGLASFAFMGRMSIMPNGRKGFTFFKFNADLALSANYFFYTDGDGVDAADWTYSTIRTAGATFISESQDVIAGDRLITYIRNESTFEWSVYSSLDWGDTWIDNGAQTLGETFTTACPVTFSQFDLYGESVTAVWYADRSTIAPIFKVVYAKTSDLEIDPLAFDLGTKQNLSRRIIHYGMVVHPYNDFRGIGAYPRDPTVGAFGTENELIVFHTGDYWKELVRRELAILRQ